MCELDTDLYALHYIFVRLINRALKQFQDAYNNHSLRTEHYCTPLMTRTNGILSSEHAGETGVQDFYSSNNQDVNIDFFGIDPMAQNQISLHTRCGNPINRTS